MKHRIRVSGIVLHEDKILLIEQHNPRTGHDYWTLPGGGLEAKDNDIFSGVEREVFEETGLRVRAGELRFISEYLNTHVEVMQISMWIACQLLEGENPDSIHLDNTQHDDNILRVQWWTKEALLDVLHPASNLNRPEFWEGLQAPPGQVLYLGKRVETA